MAHDMGAAFLKGDKVGFKEGQATGGATIDDDWNLAFINVVQEDAVGRKYGIGGLVVLIMNKRLSLLPLRVDLLT
eukprot:7810024-Ditylum_brightwellii.AAC.1